MNHYDLLALVHTARYLKARWQTRLIQRLGWIALVLAVTLAAPGCDQGFSPVQQLTAYHDELPLGTCTAFAVVHGGRHVWLSAAHCAEHADRFVIGGLPATPVLVDETLRLVALDGPQSTDTVALARHSPERPTFSRHTAVSILGFPVGWSEPMLARGVLSTPAYDFAHEGHLSDTFALYNVTVAHGDSGSPVFTDDAQVIGVVQLTLCDAVVAFCPESAGTPVEFIRAFLQRLK